MATDSPPLRTEPASAPRRKFLSLQAGRGIAAVLIVLHHASSYTSGEPRLWVHPQLGRWFVGPSLSVAFFFVLSGIVMLIAHWNDIGRPAAVRSYLDKRFRRIYPIYWLVLALVLCGQLYRADPRFPSHRNPFVILSNILLIHIHSTDTSLVVAWTLFHEVAFYAVFATLLLHRRTGICILAAWFGASAINLHGSLANHPSAFFAPVHLLFGLGMLAAWMFQRRKVPWPRLIFAAGTLFFFAMLVYSGYVEYLSQRLYLVSGIGAVLALLGAMELERGGHLFVPPWLNFLGKSSYSIYLIHFPVISHLAPLAFRLDAHLHLPIVFWMLALLAAGTTAGCLLHVYIERPLLNWLGRPRLQPVPAVAQAA